MSDRTSDDGRGNDPETISSTLPPGSDNGHEALFVGDRVVTDIHGVMDERPREVVAIDEDSGWVTLESSRGNRYSISPETSHCTLWKTPDTDGVLVRRVERDETEDQESTPDASDSDRVGREERDHSSRAPDGTGPSNGGD